MDWRRLQGSHEGNFFFPATSSFRLTRLYQVYLSVVRGHVLDQIVHCLAAFLEFCYLVRWDSITETTLEAISVSLAQYHMERIIFEKARVRNNFNLPQQHSLHHYRRSIQLFGAPNGLCSSITESKHIKAVKEPWRRSSCFQALGQMLVTNQRIDKLSASRVDFISHGLLLDMQPQQPFHPNVEPQFGDPDAIQVAGPRVLNVITLAIKCGSYSFHDLL